MWKPRHDNKVYQTTKEVVVYNLPSPTCRQNGTNAPCRKSSIPHIVSRAEWFDNLKSRSDFPNARPLDPKTKDDYHKSNKFCKFHKDHSYLTKHCRELAAYINCMIHKGELDVYFKDTQGCLRDRCKPADIGKRPCSDSSSGFDYSENRF